MGKTDNPPAFPFVLPDESGSYQMVEPGMSLRDWFAGQALAMSNPDRPSYLAEWAFSVADAMLAESQKGRQP